MKLLHDTFRSKLRRLTVALLILPMTWFVAAQNTAGSPVDQEQNLRDLGNLNAFTPGAMGFDNRYEGIQGSPMLFDDWMSGTIQFVSQDTFTAPITLNIELVRQVVVVKLRDGSMGEMGAMNIKAVQVGQDSKKDAKTYIVAKENEVEGVKSVRPKFYEALHLGAFNFLKETRKEFRKADFKGPYSADRRYDEFLTEEHYWLQVPGQAYEKVRTRKRDIEKTLSAYEDQVAALSKEHKLNLNKAEDIATLLEFLETSER